MILILRKMKNGVLDCKNSPYISMRQMTGALPGVGQLLLVSDWSFAVVYFAGESL
jgi:hypothetical protein